MLSFVVHTARLGDTLLTFVPPDVSVVLNLGTALSSTTFQLLEPNVETNWLAVGVAVLFIIGTACPLAAVQFSVPRALTKSSVDLLPTVLPLLP